MHRTSASLWMRSVLDGLRQYFPKVGLPNEVLSVLLLKFYALVSRGRQENRQPTTGRTTSR